MTDNVTPMRADVDVQHDLGGGVSVGKKFPRFMELAPIPLIALACLSLVFNVYLTDDRDIYPAKFDDIADFLSFVRSPHWMLVLMSILWVLSMGCVGGIASLSLQAIKADVRSVPDITNKHQVILRVTLGCLFSLALTFPFESDCFTDLCHYIGTGQEFGKEPESPFLRALVLILPFLLGFSTELVMSIINQLNSAVVAFFGQLGPGAKGGAAPSSEQPGR